MSCRLPALISASLAGCLVLVSCSGGSETPLATDPAATSPESSALPLAKTMLLDDHGAVLSNAGVYRWHLDPVAATFTSELVPTRAGADNDGRYLLPVNEFLRPSDLRIDRFRFEGGALEIDYTFTHPFASSEISNRADLGFTGFLLFLADTPDPEDNTYTNELNEPIIIDRDLILNPDAYWTPAGFIEGFFDSNANTFPYKLIVSDGGQGNRVRPQTGNPISNGGNALGNFDPTLGWQSAQGASSDWTGFDVLHQGQAATGTLELDLDTLRARGPIGLEVVVMAKYVDPKSAAPGFEHRLPGEPADVLSEFGYRYPYGALDVSKIIFEGQSQNFVAGTASEAFVHFHIRDWDARATATSSSLADLADPMLVPTEEVGNPNLFWSSPALLGDGVWAFAGNVPESDDSAYGGDPEIDSGRAGDGLYYAPLLSRTGSPSDARGSYPALLEVLDQNTTDNPSVFLDAFLDPLTETPPRNVTYFPFDIKMDSPLGSGWGRQFTGTQNEVVRDIAVDAAGQVWVSGIYNGEADFGGGVRTAEGGFDCFLMAFDKFGTYRWDRTWGSTGFDDVAGVAVRPDGQDALVTGNFEADLTFEGSTYVPQSWDGFLFHFDSAGTTSVVGIVQSGGLDRLGKPVSTGIDNGFVFGAVTGGNVDIAGTMLAANVNDGYTARLDQFNTLQWGAVYEQQGNNVVPRDVTVLPSGAVVTTGAFVGDADFGGGTRTNTGSSDIFVVRHTDTGAYVWDRTFGSTATDDARDLASGFGGRIAVVGSLQGSADFGGGLRAIPMDSAVGYALCLSAGGAYQWDQVFQHAPGSSSLAGVGILPGSGGDVVVGGEVGVDGTFGGVPYDVTTINSIYMRLEETTGVPVWTQTFSKGFTHRIEALTLGPEDSVYYGLSFGGVLDVEPGPGVTNLTAPGTFTEAGVVKLYADNTW